MFNKKLILLSVFLVCGKPYIDRTLIVAGSQTKVGDYPWQAALYRVIDKELICGGSLLNERVILTGTIKYSQPTQLPKMIKFQRHTV